MCMNSRCIGPVVSVGCVWDLCISPKRPAQAHATPHTLMQLLMSVRYSVPDVLHSTPGVERVYWRRYTRILLCVTLGWEPPVPWYHVIYGNVTYDMYVIYMSCFSQLYVMLLIAKKFTHLHISGN